MKKQILILIFILVLTGIFFYAIYYFEKIHNSVLLAMSVVLSGVLIIQFIIHLAILLNIKQKKICRKQKPFSHL